MVETFTWLYGASQGQQCRYCGDVVYPLATTLRSHEFWCDARKVLAKPDSVTYGVSEAWEILERVSEAREILERAAHLNRAALDRLAR